MRIITPSWANDVYGDRFTIIIAEPEEPKTTAKKCSKKGKKK